MHTRAEFVDLVIDVCHRLYDRGYVTATDGNVSVRQPDKTILTTRSGVNKGRASAADLVEISLEGKKRIGSGEPSTEIGMHLFIYRSRPDINAVVHAHPTYATGFAAARVALDVPVFPEVLVGFGTIPLAPYATPSTDEVANSLAPFVAGYEAILLANHGVVTYASTLEEAFDKMEKVEHVARMMFVAKTAGGAVPLTKEEIDRLASASENNYKKKLRRLDP